MHEYALFSTSSSLIFLTNIIIPFEDFKNIRDVSEATELFERYFERAGVVALAERLRFAEAFYRQYK